MTQSFSASRLCSLTLSVSEQRKMFITQTRSQPCSGEEQSRKPLVQPTLLPHCPLYLSMLPSCSPKILLQNHKDRKLPHPRCHPHLSNFTASYPLTSRIQARISNLFSLTHPTSFYGNYVLYQCCDIINSILLGICDVREMKQQINTQKHNQRYARQTDRQVTDITYVTSVTLLTICLTLLVPTSSRTSRLCLDWNRCHISMKQ